MLALEASGRSPNQTFVYPVPPNPFPQPHTVAVTQTNEPPINYYCLYCHGLKRVKYTTKEECELHMLTCKSCPVGGCYDSYPTVGATLAHIRDRHIGLVSYTGRCITHWLQTHNASVCNKCGSPFYNTGIHQHERRCNGRRLTNAQRRLLTQKKCPTKIKSPNRVRRPSQLNPTAKRHKGWVYLSDEEGDLDKTIQTAISGSERSISRADTEVVVEPSTEEITENKTGGMAARRLLALLNNGSITKQEFTNMIAKLT